MKQLTLLLAAFCACCYCADAQVSLSGKIQHEGEPLAGAVVELQNAQHAFHCLSNAEGAYEFKAIPPGRYALRIQLISYKTLRDSITLSNKQKQVDRHFSLESDQLQLEQMVITGTRSSVPLYESPVMVSSVSTKMLESTQSITAAEGLRFSSGLRVENNCQNCGFTQLRINGLEGAYSQILINNRPVFSALAGVYGLEMLPASMIDRVEVVKGGGSVMYGGNAIGGTVNIITKDPTQNTLEAKTNLSWIDGSTPDHSLSLNGSWVNEDLSTGATFYAFKRQRQPWDANDDGFSEITQLQNTTLGLNAFHKFSRRSRLSLQLNAIEEDRRGGNDFDLEPHQSDIAEALQHQIMGGQLAFEQFSRNFKHRISLYTSAQITQRKSYYGAGGRVLEMGDSLTEDDYLAMNAYGQSHDISTASGFVYHYDVHPTLLATLGTEWQYNRVNDEMPGYARSISQRVNTIGSFAQVEWDPLPKWCITAGARFDHVDIQGLNQLEEDHFSQSHQLNIPIPRVAVAFNATERMKLRASFAQGYRAPQAFNEDLHIEIVGGSALFVQLADDLEAERSNSYNASVNYTKPQGKWQLNATLEGFYTQLTNPFILTEQQVLPSGIQVIKKDNGTGATVRGINAEAQMAYGNQWQMQLGYTMQQAFYQEAQLLWSAENGEDATYVDRLLRAPNHYGFFALEYTPTAVPLAINFSGVYTGSMLVAHVVNPETARTVVKESPRFFELNTKVTYNLKTKSAINIALFAGVQNLFNQFQQDFDRGMDRDAGYVYGPTLPRTFFTGAAIKLQ